MTQREHSELVDTARANRGMRMRASGQSIYTEITTYPWHCHHENVAPLSQHLKYHFVSSYTRYTLNIANTNAVFGHHATHTYSHDNSTSAGLPANALTQRNPSCKPHNTDREHRASSAFIPLGLNSRSAGVGELLATVPRHVVCCIVCSERARTSRQGRGSNL